MRVICRDSAVSTARRNLDMPDGLTIADYAARSEMPGEVWTHGVATLGSERFLPDTWSKVRPKRGAVLGLSIAPQGPGLPVLRLAGSSFLKSALLTFGKDPSTSVPRPGREFFSVDLGQGGIASNTVPAYEQIGAVLGQMWVSPRALAPPWVEYVGDTAITRGIYGFAGRHLISEVRINGADVNGNDAITTNIRDGSPASDPATIYTTTVWQQDGLTPSRHAMLGSGRSLQHTRVLADVEAYDLPREHRWRIGDGPDRVVIDIEFPDGLFARDRTLTGTARVSNVPFRLVIYKPDGTSFVLPELHIGGDFARNFRTKIVLEWQADPGGLFTSPFAAGLWKYAFAKSTAMDTEGTTADSYFGTAVDATHVGVNLTDVGDTPGSYRAQDKTITVYLDPATLPKDNYELGITVGSLYRNDRINSTTTEYSVNGTTTTNPKHFSYYVQGGTQHMTMEDQAYSSHNVNILAITSEWDTEPLDLDGLATVEIQAVNVSVDRLAVLAERIVLKKWSEASSTWVATPGPSRNPAELVYDILTNSTENEHPVDATLIAASLGDWADWCSTNNRTCDAVVESGSVEDSLRICFQAGQAMPIFDGTYGAVIEKDRSAETPEIIYTPRNSRGFTAERDYEKLPHALLATFNDADILNEPREVIVPYDGYTEATATRLEALDFKGVTAEWDVEYLALLELRKRYLRRKRYVFETDARYLISTRGSLIGVKHDMLDTQLSYARIVAVHRDSSNQIVGITTDAVLTMNSGSGDIYSVTDIYAEPDIYSIGASTGIAIVALDGTVVLGVTAQSYNTRDITFSTPLAADSDIQPGCDVVSGTVDSEFRRLIIESIEPGEISDEGATARIVCYDEAPTLFS